MNYPLTKKLRQRADYTHKFNANSGRYGWLRLTPAYSVKIVEELMACHGGRRLRVLDPFCGTATTALSAAYYGHDSVTTDINPFLVWLGNVKTAKYSATTIKSTRAASVRAVDAVMLGTVDPVDAPFIHNIDRWWCAESLSFLRNLMAGIEAKSEERTPERNLMLVAFCRTLIELSNVSFNHQSMSLINNIQPNITIGLDMKELYMKNLRFVLEGAADNPNGTVNVVLADARKLSEIIDDQFDLIITSPPYANRMSYIRELRPYMYWLGYLTNGRDAGDLDWSAIGGTWGVATSRLINWETPADPFTHPLLEMTLTKIAHEKNKNGRILANYVAKYFNDIREHMVSLLPTLRSGSKLHYIVGNSTFYGVLLPVEKLYAEIFQTLGFKNVQCDAIRKRNSKKELFEFDVSACWPG